MATDDLEARVGLRVRDLREGRSWTQEELAARMTERGGVRVYQSTVAKIEKAGRPLRVNELEILAAVFETSMAALVEQSAKSRRDVALEIVERRRAERRAAADRVEAAQNAAVRAQKQLDDAQLKLDAAEWMLNEVEESGDSAALDGDTYWWPEGGWSRGQSGEEA